MRGRQGVFKLHAKYYIVLKIHVNGKFFKKGILYYIGVYHEGFIQFKGEVTHFKNMSFFEKIIFACVFEGFLLSESLGLGTNLDTFGFIDLNFIKLIYDNYMLLQRNNN